MEPELRAERALERSEAMSVPLPGPESAEEADTRLTREETFAIDRMIQRHDKEKLEPDLVRDIMWAYRGLDWRNARVQDAPSAGAWSLLKWAREYRNRFFEQMLPKALAAREREKGEGEGEEVKGERKSLEEVARVLRSLEGSDASG
ncbi:MAG: hypothetical protein V1755_06485 [Chloroflexota bacterium]